MEFLKTFAVFTGIIFLSYIALKLLFSIFMFLLPFMLLGGAIYYINKWSKKEEEAHNAMQVKKREVYIKSPGYSYVTHQMRELLNDILPLLREEFVSEKDNLILKTKTERIEKLFKEEGAGYVLFIQEKGTGNVKITKAFDPYQRMVSGLLKESLYDMDIVHMIKADHDTRLEKSFLEFFKEKEIGNSWFNLSSEDLAWVKSGDLTNDMLESISESARERVRSRR